MRGGVAAWRKAGLPLVSREEESMTQLADLCPECTGPASAHAG